MQRRTAAPSSVTLVSGGLGASREPEEGRQQEAAAPLDAQARFDAGGKTIMSPGPSRTALEMKVAMVELRRIDDDIIERLVLVVVKDAAPEEVMPPVTGPPGWTLERQEAFREFHRRRRGGLEGPCQEVGFAIVAHREVVGVARLARRNDGAHEIGLWIGRSHRGQGIGTATLAVLRSKAAELGVNVLWAETTATNTAALSVLRHHGAVLSPGTQGEMHARIGEREARS